MVSLEPCLASQAKGAEPNITYKGSGVSLARSGACKFVQGLGDTAAHPLVGAVVLQGPTGRSICVISIRFPGFCWAGS